MSKEEEKNKIINAALIGIGVASVSGTRRRLLEDLWDSAQGSLIAEMKCITQTTEVPKYILDEYAKQQAISFAKWTEENSYAMLLGGEYWEVPYEGPYGKQYTTDQLYNLFIEQSS